MVQIQLLVQRFLRVLQDSTFFSGAVAGMFLVCAMTPLRLVLGTNREVDTATMLAAVLCCGLIRGKRADLLLRDRRPQIGLVFAAIWTLLLPDMLGNLLEMLGWVSLNRFEVSAVAYFAIALLTVICLTPVLVAVRMSHLDSNSHNSSAQWGWLLGLGMSCLILPSYVLPQTGTGVLSIVGLMVSIVILIVKSYSRGTMQKQIVSPDEGQTETASSTRVGWLASNVAVATGVGLALTVFVGSQLIPRNLIGDLALFSGLVIGMGLALARPHLRVQSSGASLSFVSLFLAAWVGVIAAGYPVWTVLCLKMNAWQDNVSLLFALRIALLMSFTVPAGFLFRKLSGHNGIKSASPMIPLLIATGFVAAPWLPFPPHWIATGVVLIVLSLTLAAWLAEGFSFPRLRSQQLGIVSLTAAAIAGLIYSGNLDSRHSERILYSPAALQSYRQGIAASQLSWIDDSRLLASFSSLSDHISVWRTHGSQIVVRQDAQMVGLHSSKPEFCPHNAADLLPALIPLAFHPDPENVLIMGAHPPSLMTCHAWPLHTVRTIGCSPESKRLIDWLEAHPETGINLQGGPTFETLHAPAVLSLASRHDQQYDVILCPLSHPLQASRTGQWTQEFYQQVSSHLSENGIFSQRIPYYDLGPEVIRDVVCTLQSVFSDVRVVESVPGELIFLSSHGALPTIDDQLVERLKLPQCRELLAQAGWDWSLVLGRGGLKHKELSEFASKKGTICTASANHLAFLLPVEVSRWGRKGDNTRMELSKFGDALRTDLAGETVSKEVSDRLEDLNLAHQIQRNHPNDPWAYRAALKTRLQERPRAAIMPVNHQLKRVMDPEDQRRKNYLQVLGPVAKNPSPTHEEIELLTEFDAPFDPLVSLFVYYETANMLARCQPAVPSRQLHHLLHTVYFSSGFDQSVRNVGEAVNLLTREDGVQMDEAKRWDEINSLMQVMAQRWEIRLNTHKTSKYESADTEHSLSAIESGVRYLEANHHLAGLSKADWANRKLTLEQALLRPLRIHRSQAAREAPLAPVVSTTEKTAEQSKSL